MIFIISTLFTNSKPSYPHRSLSSHFPPEEGGSARAEVRPCPPAIFSLFREARRGTGPRIKLRAPLVGAAVLLCAFAASARPASATRISGELFSEFYSVARHHDPDVRGQHDFWFRRINITFDSALSSGLSFRLKFEMSSPGDFKTNSLLVPFVKDAYLDYRLKDQALQIGIISTPTWENVESFWGYRVLEKTPCDLQKLGSARDFGIALKGDLNASGTVSYKVMFGNGEGPNAQIDRGKKAYAQFLLKPLKGLHVDLYADAERRKDTRALRLYQVFSGYEARWGRVGFLYARRDARLGEARDTWRLWSAFSVIKVRPKAEVVLRYDRMLDPNPEGPGISYIPFSDRAASNLLVAGVGWRLSENLIVIPNIKHVFYDKLGSAPEPGSDTYLNLSAGLRF